jgi:hypothetical protein
LEWFKLKEMNQEILDKFGKLLIREVFDCHYSFVKNDLADLKSTERFKNLFSNMDENQKGELEKMQYELLSGMLFDFLKIFEENREFKIIYDKEGNQIDLNKISEMLKAEPIINGGWIERFSQYKEDRISY